MTRSEPWLFLFFLALPGMALIEREIRLRMRDADLTTLPIHPEDRDCPAPTAERILDIVATVQPRDLVDARGHLVQSFEPELTPIQRRVLRLLGVSPALHRRVQPRHVTISDAHLRKVRGRALWSPAPGRVRSDLGCHPDAS